MARTPANNGRRYRRYSLYIKGKSSSKRLAWPRFGVSDMPRART